ASHILVDTMEEAQKVMEEINNGLTFEEAAGKYSTCPSKENGGDLGQFSRGQMVPEFEEEAFKMEEDSISEPVKTQFGYHIINLKEKDAGGLNSFDEVKNQIHENLLRLKQQEKYLNKIDQLKNEYKVEYVNN
ncbi:MAG TPA: peptidylprolyl isomerase, partial [Tissierellaceae bacterium]|nr:peptidylprolyl isomerase [Tissierellaceae bacterium]